MSTITDYTVINVIYTEVDASGMRDKLSRQVKDYIAAGWQPHGQMTSETFGGALILMQPMVKYAEESPAASQ